MLNGIILQFKYKEPHLYDEEKPGKYHIEQMKNLAQKGKRLTIYVNQHIRDNYKEKLCKVLK